MPREILYSGDIYRLERNFHAYDNSSLSIIRIEDDLIVLMVSEENLTQQNKDDYLGFVKMLNEAKASHSFISLGWHVFKQ